MAVADDVTACAVERAQLELADLYKEIGRALIDLDKKRQRVLVLEARIATTRKGIGESEGDPL